MRLGFIAATTVLLLTACAGSASAPAAFLASVPLSRLDDQAEQSCEIHEVGLRLVAAMDSNAAEVRSLAAESRAGDQATELLPAGDQEYVAICIYDTEGSDLSAKSKYLAIWVDERAQYTVVLFGW